MTDGDRFQFAQSFTQLAVALRLPATKAPDALKTQMRVYFEALRDLPFPAVEESVTVLQRRGSGFFPSTQEWYRVADDLAYRTLLDADARRPALRPPARSDDAFARAKRPDRHFWPTCGRKARRRTGWTGAVWRTPSSGRFRVVIRTGTRTRRGVRTVTTRAGCRTTAATGIAAISMPMWTRRGGSTSTSRAAGAAR